MLEATNLLFMNSTACYFGVQSDGVDDHYQCKHVVYGGWA
jgi:hypothetical protein